MNLFELFNRPYAIDSVSSSPQKHTATFTDEAHNKFFIRFEPLSDEEFDDFKGFIQFIANDVWEVTFSNQTEGRNDMTITGGVPNPARVFGTVIEFIERKINTQKPDVMLFAASMIDKSRVKLYDRMVKALKVPGYETSRFAMPGEVVYVLSKPGTIRGQQ